MEAREVLADLLHGADCTCPYSPEDPDREKAGRILARLAEQGYVLVNVAELRAKVEALPEPTLGLKGGVSRAAVLALLDEG